ncbi:hypothetical protein G6011_11784 [Alternaria panax]|uniref:DJ-1/PfpI domain-containing protein n=1 Tax=Alternaria panax TaxID=48097 RepID=A0AAD4FCE8_9PLEO|nr:hypothetical protein G6011_11784 [Alternaria panax]
MLHHVKLLIGLKSQDILPTREGAKTEWYLPELVHPYSTLILHIYMIFASSKGVEAPSDLDSIEDSKNDKECQWFLRENETLWKNTESLAAMLDRTDKLVGILFVGGHGLRSFLDSVSIFSDSGRIVSTVCNGSAELVNVKPSDGSYMIQDQAGTGLSNAKEDANNFTNAMPILREDELKNHGNKYEKVEHLLGVKVVVSGKQGNLVTGQDPPSAGVIEKILLELIQKL